VTALAQDRQARTTVTGVPTSQNSTITVIGSNILSGLGEAEGISPNQK